MSAANNFFDAGFWESNSAVLEKKYPGLLEEISREADLENGDYQIESSTSGLPSLKIRGLYVHSPRDPVREGRRIAESLNTADAGAKDSGGPVIILGFGLGYTAQAAGELWPERPLIIVEKYRSLLRLSLELRDLRPLLSRNNVVFAPGGSGEGIISALSFFDGPSAGQPSVIRNRSLTGLDEEWYTAVEGRIRTWTMRDDVNMATLKRFGKRWVRNLSQNMTCIRDLPGISRLSCIADSSSLAHNAIDADTAGMTGNPSLTHNVAGLVDNSSFAPNDNCPKDTSDALPVFLAAAGPGLEQTVPLLAEIRRRCIVVAVDTSLRFLLKHGIAADFVLAVDPQFWNSRHLDRCSLEQTRLIAESAVYPDVLRLPFRGSYLCGSLFPLGSFIEKRVDPKGDLGAGGSVATTAWDFARVLGARQIWIAGLDLAFPGLKTHFRGAAFEEKSLAQSGRTDPSETWLVRALRDGQPFRAPAASSGKVLTDRRLSLYAAWFENRFRQHPDIRNYSLSTGGLAIAGLETAGADSLLALPERRDEINLRIESAFSRIEADFFEPEEAQRRAERFDNALRTLLRGLEEIKAAAERGVKIAGQALKRNPGAKEQDKILKDLDEITRSISDSEVKEVAGFLFPPAAESEQVNGDPFRAYLESSARFYRNLAEAAEFNVREMKKRAQVTTTAVT